MPATVAQARDQMMTLFKDAIDGGGAPVTGFVTIWDGVDKQPTPPTFPTPWARIAAKHNSGNKSSLANANGVSRYTRRGILVVQLFTDGGKGLVSNDEILAIILGAYEGKTTTGGLVFRNCRFQEVGADGPWFQTNFFADFEYDEVK